MSCMITLCGMVSMRYVKESSVKSEFSSVCMVWCCVMYRWCGVVRHGCGVVRDMCMLWYVCGAVYVYMNFYEVNLY